MSKELDLILPHILQWLSLLIIRFNTFWAEAVDAQEFRIGSVEATDGHAVETLIILIQLGSYDEAIVNFHLIHGKKQWPEIVLSSVHDTDCDFVRSLVVRGLFTGKGLHVDVLWQRSASIIQDLAKSLSNSLLVQITGLCFAKYPRVSVKCTDLLVDCASLSVWSAISTCPLSQGRLLALSRWVNWLSIGVYFSIKSTEMSPRILLRLDLLGLLSKHFV